MGEIKAMQFEVDQTLIDKENWLVEKAKLEQEVDSKKVIIWENLKKKLNSDMKAKKLNDRLAGNLDPLNEEHFKNLIIIDPTLKTIVKSTTKEEAAELMLL